MKIVKYLIMSFFTLSIICQPGAACDDDSNTPLEHNNVGLMLTVDVSCDPSELPAIINVRLNDFDSYTSNAGYFVYVKQKTVEVTHILATLSLMTAITLVVILDPFVEPVCKLIGL